MDKEEKIGMVSPFCENPDDLRSIAEALVQWGCCLRCVLRFQGHKDQGIYKQSIQDIAKEINICLNDASGDDDTTPDPANQVCTACLGILQQQYCYSSFLDEINEKIRTEDFEYKDFLCALSTPVTVIVREHSLWILLREKFRSVYEDSLRDSVTPLKDVWKWINGPILAEKLDAPFDQKSPFEIALNFTQLTTEQECSFLFDLYPDVFKKRKHNKFGWEIFTRSNVKKVVNEIAEPVFRRHYSCPPRRLNRPCDCDIISASQESTFFAGRYNKYSRTLSQTPWFVDGGRKSASSIEELICEHLMSKVRATEWKFSASGREDVDVKMLGKGRPFVVEFINPHRITFSRKELGDMQRVINDETSDIFVRDLQLVSKDEIDVLKQGEQDKKKSYSAICWSERVVTQEELDSLKVEDLVLKQKTPIRVLHRRPLAVRERTIHSLRGKMQDGHHFNLYLSTQAGTYVKEFVHGDFGRTQPNLGKLLNTECDILELNVEEVELDWPKPVDSAT